MMSLFEMMSQAQNGDAMKAMARQFGLSEAQVEQAMEALMPAFSTGLKRNAQSPMDAGKFLQALAGGNHARYFDDMSRAFSPEGKAEGDGILGHIFGSKDVSRAVAAQAAAATGIGQDILKQMLPALATTIMGGLFKQSTDQTRSAAGSGNVIGDILGEMMKGGFGGDRKAAPAGGNNPFGQILEGMFGGQASQGSRPAGDPMADNPFGKMFKDMLGGANQAQPEPEPAPASEPSRGSRNPMEDIFGKMFESGREVQRGYQKDMESIFDQYLQGMKRDR